ncbi:hypothetical protein IAR55_004454 [Kwoniella newhampshirensis]|uniref:Phosducin thioredoxin-like domain-containing protein n=1 Tax=Kwoniella newhampshirensis TaxID=1651941 RepID=A0AAW0YKB6_9TREE
MGGRLEQAALDGSLFSFDPTAPSPTRSDSTSSLPDTDDESASSDLDHDDDGPSSSSRNKKIGQWGDTTGRGVPRLPMVDRSEADGAAQTGPKGVIEDRKAAQAHSHSLRQEEKRKRGEESLRRGMTGLTVHEESELVKRQQQTEEEEEEEEEEGEGVEQWRRRRRLELQLGSTSTSSRDIQDEEERAELRGAKRGGLKEVGREGFVDAVERSGWVVVLIYEPGIPRCTSLLTSLLHLSFNQPANLATPLTLYRARATSLAFSLLPPTQGTPSTHQDHPDDVEEEDGPRGRPDPDVLPTMLAYKDGELEKKWVRVDWDVREDGVEGLLRREGILSPVYANTGRPASSRRGLLDGSDEDEQ